MRITTLILLTALLQVSASSLAQKISIDKKNASIQTILNEISKQSGYDFFYDANALKKIKPISVVIKNADLDDAVRKSLEGLPLSYSIDSKTVIIKEAEPSFLDRIIDRFAAVDVRGRVLDEAGNPLVGATIQVKGKAQAYKTKENGEFEIKGVDEEAVLLVSYVGYKQLEISLKDAVMPLEIKLNVATGELEEVNVTYSTGYQNIPKERATGSFVQLSNEDINRTVSTNILDRLVNITNSLRYDPKPGGSKNNSNVTIRGSSTINANKKPLIVVDGFPYREGEEFGDILLNNLNPNDVESVTILRDAAAASIWGARAGNGVIVITTKKGRFNQKTNVQFNSNANIIERARIKDQPIISSADALQFERSLFASGYYNSYDDTAPASNSFPALSPGVELLLTIRRDPKFKAEAENQLSLMAQHDVRDDINKYLTRNAINQQYNLNVSGGTSNISYYGSIGYDRNLNNSVGNENNRLTLRLENKFRLTKRIEVGGYIIYTGSVNTNNAVSINKIAPYTFLADVDGFPVSVPNGLRSAYVDTLKSPGLLDWKYRPLDELKYSDNTSNQYNTRFGGTINYKIIDGLNIELKGQSERGSIDLYNYQSIDNYITRNRINTYMYKDATGKIQYPIPFGGILYFSNSLIKSWDLRSQLNFNKNYGRHFVSGIFGFDARQASYNMAASTRYGYDPENLTYASNMDYRSLFILRPSGSGSQISDGNNSRGTLDRFRSYYANIGYTFNNKYTITGSGRVDASNFFGVKANLKHKPLWSAGASWDVSKEVFFYIKNISSFKLRTTYGFNGNMDNTATALPTIVYSSAAPSSYNSSILARRDTPPNPGLSWEKVSVFNVALDIIAFDNRISATVEFYKKKGIDLIGNVLSEATSGTDTYMGNYASMKGEGIDFNFRGVLLDKQIKLITQFNLSYNTDKITNYYLSESSLASAGIYLSNSAPIIGRPTSKIFSYRWAGLNGLTGDPMGIINGQIVPFSIVMGNTNSLPNTKPTDLIYQGQAFPKFFGCIMPTVQYRDLSISLNFTYKLGYFFRRSSINYRDLVNNWTGHSDYALRWKKPGDELFTDIPSFSPGFDPARDTFYALSEKLVEKGDHIRFQDVRISYSIGLNEKKMIPFRNASIYLYANNLGIIWRANKYHIDPDYSTLLKPSRSIAFGININL